MRRTIRTGRVLRFDVEHQRHAVVQVDYERPKPTLVEIVAEIRYQLTEAFRPLAKAITRALDKRNESVTQFPRLSALPSTYELPKLPELSLPALQLPPFMCCWTKWETGKCEHDKDRS